MSALLGNITDAAVSAFSDIQNASVLFDASTNSSQPGFAAASTTATEPAHSDHNALFVSALLMLVLITCAINLAHFLARIKFNYLGESAIYILLGLLISVAWTSIAYDPHNTAIKLDSSFFALVLLPPIIFEGGFNLQRKSFFNNIIPILSLSLLGAFYSTFVTSAIMWVLSHLVSDTRGWSVIECLVFGSLISSTDPVTVLALLPPTVDRRLYMLIFGESALNDAVSIILYRFFTNLQKDAATLTIGVFALSVVASVGVFLGSFCVGVILAMIFAKITKHVWIDGYDGAIYEMVMLVVFAYSSYLLAEVLGLTGIISIFFCGVAMSHYAYSNLTVLTQRTMRVTIRMISLMCEGFIFLYLGLGLMSFGVVYDAVFIIFALLAIVAARSHVFIICSISNLFPGQPPIPLNQQTLMWFSGLRGAVAFALGVQFLENPDFHPAIKGLIFGTTVMVVVMTVLIFGGLTPYMLVWLGITDGTADAHGAHSRIEGGTDDGRVLPPVDESDDSVITEEDLEQPIFGALYRFDCQYIRPHLSHNATDHIQALAAIERRNSRVSRQTSMAEFRASQAARSNTHFGFTMIQSPKHTSAGKQDNDDDDDDCGETGPRTFDDRANLIAKSSTTEDIPLEAVHLG